jgi:hypothetical protein
LVKTFGKPPDDPFFETMNPFLRLWLYEGWIHDIELETEKLRSQSIFIGSFFNPEMAQKIIKADKPDFEATDSEETANKLHEQIVEQEQLSKKKKKKHKVIKSG